MHGELACIPLKVGQALSQNPISCSGCSSCTNRLFVLNTRTVVAQSYQWYAWVQTIDMHAGWNEALPLTLLNLYDALLSGNLDLRVRLTHRHDNQDLTLRRLLHLSGETSFLVLLSKEIS